ncbi:arylamine N-acetyltransferase family protein [Microbulbifer halophilus]|uniref:Arylamine N-acetyltransferase n=1 Tax=Microbulbifer halophilus TaxID=453963 RepID=A0ABW5EG34_9GAMM|nr:arylamine N-acetyltransferase [Microbulbifer halophilus]MCW8127220.1 arylamine N-acetyltransferase [Microbulbifer halophilus]
MKTAIDLDAYLRRIGFAGKPAADLETLEKVVGLHSRAIPFENLNPFLGLPVEIDLPSVERKLVEEERGGYCFEQNTLLQGALTQLDIPHVALAARILWQQPEHAYPAQSHMLLRADIKGIPYLVDVGVGGQTPTVPLRMDMEMPQHTSYGSYRIERRSDDFLLQMKARDKWWPIYSFDLRQPATEDYEIFNWYWAAHPKSPFINELTVARVTGSGRLSLLNNRLTFYPKTGTKSEKTLRDLPELRRTLTEAFGIRLPDSPNLGQRLQEVLQPLPPASKPV